ncbi:hypothetical protein ACQP1W_12745 [Spirillospora sp. CA-255316]
MYLKDDGTLDHRGLARDLRGIVSDRASCDPPAVLAWLAARLAADPGGGDGPALVLALYATSPYAIWRIRRVAVVDALITAAERAVAAYGALDCPAPGVHRHPLVGGVDDHEAVAGLVAGLGEHEGLRCPAFLAGLASSALTTLRNGRRARFEAPDTADLDAYFLTPDGRTDIERLTLTVERHRPGGPNDLAEQAALWAARRLIARAGSPLGEEERLGLFLTVCFAAQHCYWCATPPAIVSVYRDALTITDPADPDLSCRHANGHPDVPPRTLLRYARALAGFGSADPRLDRAAWHCPRHTAERAARALAYTAGYLDPEGPRQKV